MVNSSEETSKVKHLLDIGLTEQELVTVGAIIAHWGAIEHEVFMQTFVTFDEPSITSDELPRAMSNLNFAEVLELWKKRVVDASTSEHKPVLTKQYDEIVRLSPFRNSLIHGMWDWDSADPKVLITSRVRKKEVIHTRFEAGDLEHFATSLAEINLLIRYPGGARQLLGEHLAQGGYVSDAVTRRLMLSRGR